VRPGGVASVPFDPLDDATREPRDATRFARDLAERVNTLLDDPEQARRLGEAGAEGRRALRLARDR